MSDEFERARPADWYEPPDEPDEDSLMGGNIRLLICGDRNWTDRRSIESYLSGYSPELTTVIHGGASGADSIAGEIAENLSMGVEVFPADWHRYGRAAGPIRNRQMLDAHVDLVVWFHLDIESSKGTKNMVAQARQTGIQTIDGMDGEVL
jgi:hypothetical protein